MKITLISTSTFPSDQGIRTVSAVLKKAGHHVNLVFMSLSEDYSLNYSLSELSQLASLCKNSEILGINSYASTAKRASRIINFLKAKFPGKIIVYGGVHPTISPEDAIKSCNIICVGEGEEAILDIANALQKKKSIEKIKNLWINKNGTIIKNPVRNLVDNIDSLPFPDFDIETHYILDKRRIRKFQERDLGGGIFFLTGRGCPYGCDYCSNSLFNKLYEGKRKKILRWHSPEYIIEGILYMKKKFPNLGYFDIRDDTFSLRPLEDIKKFCDLYKEKVHMRFKCLTDPKTTSDEKIKLLVDAGCTDIIVGIQGSQRTNAEIYHRAQSDADVLHAAKVLNKYKDRLAVMYDVITCNPYEKPEDIISLIKLIRKIPKPFFLSVNNLVFFPGSQLYRRAIVDGKIKSEKDTASQLNYWDRSKHILLKKKNIYLNLIINLMRGPATPSRYGMMPAFILDYLLEPRRIKHNLDNQFPAYLATRALSVFDLTRERILKPMYRSLPVSFKIWYDKTRYKV
jgi:anaerobic magnesium-protoporphyrin IX monomethyl ester cyclase